MAVDLTKTVTKIEDGQPVVHKHNYEAPSVAAVIIALVGGAIYSQTHGAANLTDGLLTCALLLGIFKLL